MDGELEMVAPGQRDPAPWRLRPAWVPRSFKVGPVPWCSLLWCCSSPATQLLYSSRTSAPSDQSTAGQYHTGTRIAPSRRCELGPCLSATCVRIHCGLVASRCLRLLHAASTLAVGETVLLMTPLFIPIETPTEGRGGCSRMTELSPTANPRTNTPESTRQIVRATEGGWMAVRR